MYSVLYKYRCHLELLMLLTWGRISSLGVPYTETSSRLCPGPALARLLGVNLTRGSPASASIAASPSSRWRVSSHRGRSTPAVREDQIIAVSDSDTNGKNCTPDSLLPSRKDCDLRELSI